MSRNRPWSATRKGNILLGDCTLRGSFCCQKNKDRLPQQLESNLPMIPSHPVPLTSLTHPHSGCPTQPHPAAGAQQGVNTPDGGASVCPGSDGFRAEFSVWVILLVSAQSEFNHGSESDSSASFPGFGLAASGRNLAKPSGQEKYLVALRGASHPP